MTDGPDNAQATPKTAKQERAVPMMGIGSILLVIGVLGTINGSALALLLGVLGTALLVGGLVIR